MDDYSGAALLLVGSRDNQTSPALMRSFHEALLRHDVKARLEVIEGRGHGGIMSDPHAQEMIAAFLHAPRRATRSASSPDYP